MNIVWLVLSSFVWAGVLTLAGAEIQRRAGLSGRQRQALWRVAAILAIAPWGVSAALAGVQALAPQWRAPEWTTLAPEYSGAALVQQGAQAIQVAPGASLPNIPLEVFVAVVLVAGWAVRAGAATRAAQSLRAVLRRTRPLEERRAASSRDRWSRRLDLRRRPSLLATGTQMSPFTCGVREPVICLPDGLAERLDDARLDFVLGHECVHVARRDAIWQPLERAIADVLWFNPFAWRIRRELDLARELSCDETVLDLTGDRRAYASTLVDVARIASGLPAGAPAASILSNPNESNLRMRVQNIMTKSRRSIWMARAGLGALVLVGAPLALAQVSGGPVPPPPPSIPLEARGPVQSKDGVVTSTTEVTITSVERNGAAHIVKFSNPLAGDHAGVCDGVVPGLASSSVKSGQKVPAGGEIGRGEEKVGITVNCRAMHAENGDVASLPPIPKPLIMAGPPEKGGMIAARHAGVVSDVRKDAETWRISLKGAADSEAGSCTTDMSGLADVSVKSGQAVKEGDVLGKGGDETRMSIRCEKIKQAAVAAPAAPAPPQAGNGPQAPDAPAPPAPPANPGIVPGSAPLPPVPPAPPAIEWKASVITGPAKVSSEFGMRVHPVTRERTLHKGVDIAAPRMTPIHAPAASRVTFAGEKEGYGRVVEITAPKGYVVRFGQLEEARVSEGDRIKAGDVIGLIGSSGPNATGPHLHLELYWNGEAVDPATVEGLQLIRRS